MDVREKLIDLILDAKKTDPETGGFTEYLADYLVSNGVTVQEWVSVDDRLPEINEDETVNCVLVTNGRVIHMAYFVNENWFFCENGQIKRPMFYDVTHWMELPKPPKGE